MRGFYNENDPVAAHVLASLASEGLIAPGHVDSRSIKDVQPHDLAGVTQAHFFAGAGLWSVAARLAGWPDEKHLWTGSCPCQPFSVAGKGKGAHDERHLWPDFFRLIRACRPSIVVGEQVAGAAGEDWFDGVRSDLAREDYEARMVVLPSLAVDAPNIRARIYWRALADANSRGRDGRQEASERGAVERIAVERAGGGDMANATGDGWQQGFGAAAAARYGYISPAAHRAANGSFWSDHEWIICHDGKARRTPRRSEPGIRDVADGLSGADHCRDFASIGHNSEAIDYSLIVPSFHGRIHAWKLAGNAINAILAAEVLAALLDIEERSPA